MVYRAFVDDSFRARFALARQMRHQGRYLGFRHARPSTSDMPDAASQTAHHLRFVVRIQGNRLALPSGDPEPQSLVGELTPGKQHDDDQRCGQGDSDDQGSGVTVLYDQSRRPEKRCHEGTDQAETHQPRDRRYLRHDRTGGGSSHDRARDPGDYGEQRNGNREEELQIAPDTG